MELLRERDADADGDRDLSRDTFAPRACYAAFRIATCSVTLGKGEPLYSGV